METLLTKKKDLRSANNSEPEYNRIFASGFIEEIWNKKKLDTLSDYLHPNFQDHSKPFSFVQNSIVLSIYLKQLSDCFQHKTIVEGVACEDDMVYIKFLMELHPIIHCDSYIECKITISGYRYLKFADGKIIDHWEIIE